MDKYMLKAAPDALSNAFQIDFESANDALKKSYSHFAESMFTALALKPALDDKLDRNIEKWAQTTAFVDLFARKRPASAQFVRQVTKFADRKLKIKPARMKKLKRWPRSNSLSPSRRTPLFSEAHAELEKRGYGKKNRDTKVKEEKVGRHEHLHESQKKSSFSETGLMSPPSSYFPLDTESFLTKLGPERWIHKEKPIQ